MLTVQKTTRVVSKLGTFEVETKFVDGQYWETIIEHPNYGVQEKITIRTLNDLNCLASALMETLTYIDNHPKTKE